MNNNNFGRLRRNVHNTNNVNPDYNGYENYKNYQQNQQQQQYNNYQNNNQPDNVSVHSSYKYRKNGSHTSSANNDNKVNTNYNRKPSSSSQGSIQKYISDEPDLICQNCINEELMEAKRRRDKDYYNSLQDQVPGFQDKYKSYNERYINSKIKEREKNSAEVSNLLNSYNNNDKERLIRENENGLNPLNSNNYNDYERFRKNYNKKQEYINNNLDKFLNKERPEITDYYNAYVNNPNYAGGLPYGEYRKTPQDLEQYRKDLLNQIEYKNKLKLSEEEANNRQAELNRINLQRQLDDENKEKYLKEKMMKDEVLRGNQQLIDEKKKKKLEEENEERKYKEQLDNIMYQNQLDEENRLRNKKQRQEELLRANLNNIELENMKKKREREEDEKYRYNDKAFAHDHEKMGRCCKCHRVFPRRLLTINKYFYSNNRV
jgi:hypothetical protein